MPDRSPSLPGRRRFRAGIALVVLGILTAALLTVSARWWFGYGTNTWVADLGDGTLYVDSFEVSEWRSPLIGWTGGVQSDGWAWTWWTWGPRPRLLSTGSAYTVWPIAPALLLAGAALCWPGTRAARRRRNNQCVRCAYSLAGLAANSPCPECGAT